MGCRPTRDARQVGQVICGRFQRTRAAGHRVDHHGLSAAWAAALYVLWRNTDDPARAPVRRIGLDDYTPAITLIPTLAQYIAMAANCDPWDAVTALLEVENQQEYRDSKDQKDRADEADTAVSLTEGHSVWWPPDRATGAVIGDQANRQ